VHVVSAKQKTATQKQKAAWLEEGTDRSVAAATSATTATATAIAEHEQKKPGDWAGRVK